MAISFTKTKEHKETNCDKELEEIRVRDVQDGLLYDPVKSFVIVSFHVFFEILNIPCFSSTPAYLRTTCFSHLCLPSLLFSVQFRKYLNYLWCIPMLFNLQSYSLTHDYNPVEYTNAKTQIQTTHKSKYFIIKKYLLVIYYYNYCYYCY